MTTKIMGGRARLVSAASALLVLSTGVAQAQTQVLVTGTAGTTTLFGAQPNRDLSFYATQATNGALNVPQQPNNFSSVMTTTFATGVVLTFMNQRVLTEIGPGALAPGFQPGGQAQPVTFAPATVHPGATLPVSAGNMRVGYRSAGGPHFGGAVQIAGFEVNQGLFQTSPAFLIRQRATRPYAPGGRAGATPTNAVGYVPSTTLLSTGGTAISPPQLGSEARYAFPWTTGSVSAVALIGPPVPYGGAGAIGLGTTGLPTAPINFRTIAGFDGRTFNSAEGTLTGSLQLVSPNLQNARYSLTGFDSIASYWDMTLTVVPEPGAVALLGTGLTLVAAMGWRRSRIR